MVSTSFAVRDKPNHERAYYWYFLGLLNAMCISIETCIAF